MTALGTLLGAFAGSSIGSSFDKADQFAMGRSTIAALNTPDQHAGASQASRLE
jgi:hypothetical protein